MAQYDANGNYVGVDEYELARQANDEYDQWRANLAGQNRDFAEIEPEHRRFHERISMSRKFGLSHRSKLKDITDSMRNKQDTNTFAHPAVGSGKSYLHGGYSAMFEFLDQADRFQDNGFAFDEMIPYTRPTRAFFDIEVKRYVGSGSGGAVGSGYAELWEQRERAELDKYIKILTDHAKGSEDMMRASGRGRDRYAPSSKMIADLARAYRVVRTKPLSEEECYAGLKVMLSELKVAMARLIGNDVVSEDDAPWDGLFVTSRCRPEKFSLHVVFERIFFDRVYLSGPLIAYEVARMFVMKNVMWLLATNRSFRWSTPEGQFRIRCLMLEGLMNDIGRFAGIKDSCIDEQVYSPMHFMGIAGTNKDDGSWPLHPIYPGGKPIPSDLNEMDDRKPRLINRMRGFRVWFPLGTPGLNKWLNHTIRGPCVSVDSLNRRPRYLFAGWEPSSDFIGDYRWHLNRPRYESDFNDRFE